MPQVRWDDTFCYGRTMVSGDFRVNDVDYIKLFYKNFGPSSSASKKFWRNLVNCIEY